MAIAGLERKARRGTRRSKCHSCWGTLDVADESGGVVGAGPEVEELSTRIQDALIAFARTRSPRTPDLATSEPYTGARRSTILLETSCRAVDAPYESERRFWTSAVT